MDTGASFTSIPAAVAESLGVRVKQLRERARITTANGEKEVPLLTLNSLSVGGLEVENLLVLVNDLSEPDSRLGLLGLNYLKHFDYTIDHRSGRMVLHRK